MAILRETPLARWVREQRRKQITQAETVDRGDQHRPNFFRLAKLSMSQTLTSEERDFVATLVRSRTLSPSQEHRFNELWAKYAS